MTNVQKLSGLVIFLAVAFAVEMAGNTYTAMGLHDWYPALVKSPLTPPGMWFGIIWTALYFLMGIAAWKVWKVIERVKSRPLAWWLIQLLAGLVWNITFFASHMIEAGLAMIIVTWGATGITLWQFGRVNKPAGLLLVPQFGWLTFAVYLNFFIAAHN